MRFHVTNYLMKPKASSHGTSSSLNIICNTWVICPFSVICQLQWRSDYQPFEHRKHFNNKLFEVRISNGLVFKWLVYVLCPMYYTDHWKMGPVHRKTRWLPFVWYSYGQAVWYSRVIWIQNPCSFRSFEYQTSLVFRPHCKIQDQF